MMLFYIYRYSLALFARCSCWRKKKAGIIFPMCSFSPSQQFVPLIEEINNAAIGFCREFPFSALYFQVSYLSLDFRKWESPQIWCPSFPEPFQSKARGRKGEKGSVAISVLYIEIKTPLRAGYPRDRDWHPLGISRDSKCYFSHSLTSREHSKTQADVFKFKHATAVTARCEQHTAQTPLSHCLVSFVGGKKKLERS